MRPDNHPRWLYRPRLRWAYFAVATPAVSRLPDAALRWMIRHHVPPVTDYTDGWTLWLDGAYRKDCRKGRA